MKKPSIDYPKKKQQQGRRPTLTRPENGIRICNGNTWGEKRQQKKKEKKTDIDIEAHLLEELTKCGI